MAQNFNNQKLINLTEASDLYKVRQPAARLPGTNEISRHIWVIWGNNFLLNIQIIHLMLHLTQYSRLEPYTARKQFKDVQYMYFLNKGMFLHIFSAGTSVARNALLGI